MDFGLLDGLRVTADGVDLTPSRPQQRVVLADLLLHAGSVVSGDDLIEALWGERPPETARTALQGHISMLRQRLGAERIETRSSGYLLRLADTDELDIRRFEQLASAAQVEDPALRSAALRRALALVGGVPLAEFRFEGFAASEAARLEEVRVAVLERWIEAELELGHSAAVVPHLQALIADHPFREELRGQLMLALYRSGRQADALRVAQEARTNLAEELGVDPGPALQRLEQRILGHDPSLLAPELPTPHSEPPAPSKPDGIVTFLVAGWDGSPDQRHGGDAFGATPGGPRELVRTVARRLGFEVDGQETSIRMAFGRARDAAASAAAIQRAARVAGIRMRIGIHSAEVIATDEGYAGSGAGTAMHICRAAHPGQILLSQATRDLLQEAPGDEASTRDLGEHRLSDLEGGRRLFQLTTPGLPNDFPPIAGLDARATNLPGQPSPLIGRTREIRQVAELLGDPGVRLVTVTGAGGAGKTRLAVHVAAELLESFEDGVFFVNLGPLPEAALVVPTIARTLGIDESPTGSADEALAQRLGARQLLLVLDNFEHLLAAGPDIAALLLAAPALKVIVTSRSAVGLPGERVYAVAPLPTPKTADAIDRVVAADSVALFTSRARSVRPGFAITTENAQDVAGICRTLDGLPLAIELAAARVGVLPPAALLSRLGRQRELLATRSPNVPDRHRTLEAAIAWSYDLLEPAQRLLFRRLGVFSGGCTLDAAEGICGDGVDVIDGLSALVDASLLRLEGSDERPRFVMLETIREYAAGQLEATGEGESMRQRHAAHFTALAELAEPHLRGSPGDWPDRLELDHDNLRVALDRLEAAGAHEPSSRLAGALWRYWYLKGYLTEGRRHLETALAAEHEASAWRGKVLIGAAVMAVNSGDFATAALRAEEGIALHRARADRWGATYCQFMLAVATAGTGDPSGAEALFAASVGTFRELGDEHSALLASRQLVATYLELGDRGRALALLEDNLRRARATGNDRMLASTLGALAEIAFDAGRIQDAGWMLQESLRIHRQLGDRLDTAVDLSRAARNLAAAGKAAVAVRLIGSLEESRDEIGGGRRASVVELNAQTLASARRQLSETAFAEAWRLGRALTTPEAVVLALGAMD